jgi:hypothetical protein
MASTTLKLAFGGFMALIVMMEVSAQSETCALKAENTQVSRPLLLTQFNIVYYI